VREDEAADRRLSGQGGGDRWRQDPYVAALGRHRRVDQRHGQGCDTDDAARGARGGTVRGRLDRRQRHRRSRGRPARERCGRSRRHRPVRYRRALPLQGVQRRVAAREPDIGERARGGGAAARGEERCGRAPARLRGPKRHGAPSAQPDEHLQRLPAAGAGRRRRSGGRIRAAAHGQGARGSGHPGPAGRGRDGSAVSRGRRRSPRGPAERAAVARNAGRPGASRRQDHRHRDPLRRPAPAGRHPLMRVTVLTGGATAERAVAFAGAAQIVAALRSRQHQVYVVDTVNGLLAAEQEAALLAGTVAKELPAVAELEARERELLSTGLAELPVVHGADVLFLSVHGGTGEGGTLQAILDVIGVPYTGSGPLASALAMDKDLSKRLFRDAGVPVPAWFMTPVGPRDVTTVLGWPVIVKPSKQGSTVGLTLVKQAKDLDAAVRYAAQYDAEVLVEQFIPGRELTVGVLGDVPLP